MRAARRGDQREAELAVARREAGLAEEHGGGLARLARGGRDALGGGLHLGRLRPRRQPERVAEVVGAEEQHVDAGQRGDLRGLLERAARLDLDHHDALGIGALQVARVAPEAGGAHAAVQPATGGVARAVDRAGGRCDAVDARDHHAGGAEVEHPAELLARRGGDADERRHARRLQLAERRVAAARPVLEVEHEPVEAGPGGDLRRQRGAEVEERAEQLLARLDARPQPAHLTPPASGATWR
jgi:hypothetical protein